jgi:hypothetical protein
LPVTADSCHTNAYKPLPISSSCTVVRMTDDSWFSSVIGQLYPLLITQMAASINRLKNEIPFFPTATEASKFSEIRRAKFDLDMEGQV